MVTEEITKETVKTIAQGMPAVAVYPWLLTPVLLAQAASGATRIRHSLRPLRFFEGGLLNNSDACVPRERKVMSLSAVMLRRKRGIQYTTASRLNHDRLCNTGRPVEPGDDI
jgi:hypothetical protein